MFGGFYIFYPLFKGWAPYLVPLSDRPRHFRRRKEPCATVLGLDLPAAWRDAVAKGSGMDGSFLLAFHVGTTITGWWFQPL